MDYASATPLLPEVRRVMERYNSDLFYNPSAIYQEGLQVKKELENYRSRIAGILGVGQKEIIYTSGGTESVNLAILGVFEESLKTVKKPHIIISAIEHPAVVKAAEEVVRRGGQLSILDVDEEGLISFAQLKKLLKKNTILLSIGLANSEIGTVQAISKVGRLLREERKNNNSIYPLLHTDASAAPSYINVNLESLQCDLISLDGSKIYGPKGIGILAKRRGVEVHRLHHGTLPAHLIAGFCKALETAVRDRESEVKRLELMRQEFITDIIRAIPTAHINGSSDSHLPNIVSISIPGILSELLLLKLDKNGLMVSVGSACSYDERESGSPIISAIGKNDLKESTLRFSFGRNTDKKDVERAKEIFVSTIKI